MTDEMIEVDTPEWREAAEECKQCLQEKRVIEERTDAARQRLLDQCEGLHKYTGGGVTVGFHYRKNFDKECLVRDHPEINLDDYMRESEEPTWVVRINK